jgi:hypothetical protein
MKVRLILTLTNKDDNKTFYKDIELIALPQRDDKIDIDKYKLKVNECQFAPFKDFVVILYRDNYYFNSIQMISQKVSINI